MEVIDDETSKMVVCYGNGTSLFYVRISNAPKTFTYHWFRLSGYTAGVKIPWNYLKDPPLPFFDTRRLPGYDGDEGRTSVGRVEGRERVR